MQTTKRPCLQALGSWLLALAMLSQLQIRPATAKPLAAISRPEAESRIRSLAHDPVAQHADEWLLAHGLYCDVYRFELQAHDLDTGEMSPVRIQMYIPRNGKRAPAILMVPTSAGVGVVEWYTAPRLCDSGLAVFLTDVNTADAPLKVMPDLGAEDRGNRLGIRKLRTVLDYIQSSARVDGGRIGLFGASLGALTGALLAEVDPRIQGSVLLVGGGNIAGMSAHTVSDLFVPVRTARKEVLGLPSDDAYDDLLRGTIQIDPVYFGYRLRPDSVFMVISNDDQMVPTEYQWELWRAIGQPRYRDFGSAHKWTILQTIFLHLDEAVTFLADRLAMTPDRIPVMEMPPGDELHESRPNDEPRWDQAGGYSFWR